MARSPDTIRRWTGVVFLTIAALMLVIGLTVLDGVLGPVAFLFYWLTCFAFTLSAATVALLDVSAVRQRAIQAQKELLEDAWADIERERKSRAGKRQDHSGQGQN